MEILRIGALFGVVWGALACDLYRRRIPNVLTVSAALLGVVFHGLAGGAMGIVMALGGLAVGLVLLLPGYLLGSTGAGDVKLMAAAGSLLGPLWAMLAGLASIAAGALIATGFAISSLISGATGPWQRYALMLTTLVSTGRVAYMPPVSGEVMARKFPYATAIALGTSATVMLGWPDILSRVSG